MNLTKEQEKALKQKNKVSAVYERTTTVMDSRTGEILQEQSETLKKTSTEPDYIKLYYKTMLAFNDVSNIPLDFIMAISSFITWADSNQQMIFKSDKLTRTTLSTMLNIKESMVTKYIKRCVESGLFLQMPLYRGCYYVNPFFIAKGKWDAIKDLRTSFDYVNGKWECTLIEEQEEPNDNQPVKGTA